MHEELRDPTDGELRLLTALLSADFPGRKELLEQLAGLKVQRIDDDGSLSLRPTNGPPASVIRRVPVEAELGDDDGVTIHALLHVVDGYLNELDVFREDGSLVRRALRSEQMRVVVY